MSHTATVLHHWDELEDLIATKDLAVQIDGGSLNTSSIIAITRYNKSIHLSESCLTKVETSAAYLRTCLAEGRSIYGVNTGFGGSAGVRTENTEELQGSLIDFLNCGVIDNPGSSDSSIPSPWVRASILIRANTLAKGHSGVRGAVIDGLLSFLRHDIVPVIPLRGSISASGDLIPLSYIAGALQGRPEIKVLIPSNSPRQFPRPPGLTSSHVEQISHSVKDTAATQCCNGAESGPSNGTLPPLSENGKVSNGVSNGSGHGARPQSYCISASEIFSKLNIVALKLEPKEGLSLVNGTAVSAGTAVLVNHDAQCLAVIAQLLTAMSVEALNGTAESFDPFFAAIRPHTGQIEAADNIRRFLHGSKLTTQAQNGALDIGGLRQDRYSLRTSSQWIGPQLENLALAHEQVEVECNSTTDNPILHTQADKILHGGNFQATSITAAMEKMRQSLQMLGRMLFVQCSEIINPSLNNGLPPNLESGEPSQGFLMKGVDISTASLQSELGFLANPMGPHVQTAEMGNQSLNSLAFVSARYTDTAVTVFMQLAASHILVVCQALDLRCIQQNFFDTLKPRLHDISTKSLSQHFNDPKDLDALLESLWKSFLSEFARTSSLDSTERFLTILRSMQPNILAAPGLTNHETLFASLSAWVDSCTSAARETYRHAHDNYATQQPTSDPSSQLLGAASRKMLSFVRRDVNVPFNNASTGFGPGSVSVGEMITRIYGSLRDGRMFRVAMECLRESLAVDDGPAHKS